MHPSSRRAPKKNLVYTMAFDSPGSESYRFFGKMLAFSLVRTFFTGDILVFRNSASPLFLVERKGLEEVYLETPAMSGQAGAERAWCWKYKVAELIENPEQYDKILFLDCDSLALRNIDHLLEGNWDIRYQPERERPGNGGSFNAFLTEAEMEAAPQREGANSGTLAVRGSRFHEVMRQWEEIDESDPVRDNGFRDQASWNALLHRELVKKELTIEPFPLGEVQFPGYLDPMYQSYSKAALTHNILPDTREKIEFTFGLYMRTFFCHPTGGIGGATGAARLLDSESQRFHPHRSGQGEIRHNSLRSALRALIPFSPCPTHCGQGEGSSGFGRANP